MRQLFTQLRRAHRLLRRLVRQQRMVLMLRLISSATELCSPTVIVPTLCVGMQPWTLRVCS